MALNITSTGARSWVVRFSMGGQRREMGLGRYPSVDLESARALAERAHTLVEIGIDPIEYRRRLPEYVAAMAELLRDKLGGARDRRASVSNDATPKRTRRKPTVEGQ